ncbi:MAG: insulinase family protein [Acidobacteria bacterium]|nr:insulinase family protein [Acidobacteriota bacterium]
MLWISSQLPARELPPAVPPPEAISFHLPVVQRLSNGLRILLIERHDVPLLTLYAIVGKGAEADPPNLPGTAEMVAGLLPEGTKMRSAAQIAQAIDQAGGTIDTGAGWDESYANVSLLSDHKELAFDLLSDMLIHPAFAPQEIERLRRQTLSALDIVDQDPSYIADLVLRRFLYEGTPYAHSEDGTPESIRHITRKDLVRFHARNYSPSRTILAVVGDITDQQCLALATRFFGQWRNHSSSHSETSIRLPAPRGRRVIVINKPDAVQTEIRVANLAIPRSSPDYYALTVANQVLGGPAANRLFDTLRTRRGLVYGASSDLKCYSTIGAWVAKTSTRSSESVNATEMMLRQMKRLRTHAISGQELEMAQSYLVGHEALEFEPPSQIADRVLELMMYHLPLDYWNHFAQHIRSLSTADVLSATQKYLHPNDDVIVLVGDVSAFRNKLKKLGPVRVVPIAQADQVFPQLEKGTAAYSESRE